MTIKRIQTEILLNVFDYLNPMDLIRCESVCKQWYCVLVEYNMSIWKRQLRQSLASKSGYNPEWIHYWLSLNRNWGNESWKMMFRLWEQWNCLDLKYQPNPKFISAEKIEYEVSPLWKLKLGQVENGLVTCQITTADTSRFDERICYTRGPFDPFEIEKEAKSATIRLKPIRFLWQPPDVHIRLGTCIRSELQVLEEYNDQNTMVTIRIWDPRVLPQGPYQPFMTGRMLDIPGQWFLQGTLYFVGLCNHRLVVRNQDSIFVYELKNKQLPTTYGPFQCSSRLKFCWSREFTSVYDFSNLSINEGLLGIRRISSLCVELYHLNNGIRFATVPLSFSQLPGHESVEFRFILSQFHLIIYDCDQLVVYDLLRVRDGELFSCSSTKIPYIGRRIRVDISDDGSFLLLTPTVHHGEIVVVDVLRQTSTSYLLQKGYHGSRLLKGCWLVLQDRNHHSAFAKTKVIWSPICM